MEAKKNKRLFKLPIVEDFQDYKKSIHLLIFAVYAIINTLVVTLSPNPMLHKFIVDIPMFFVLLYLFRKVLINDAKVFKDHFIKYLPFVLIGTFLIIGLSLFSGGFQFNDIEGPAPNQAAAELAFLQAPLLGAFAMVIIAPILEELMFRRSIRIIVKNTFLFHIISAFLFGVAHLLIGFSFPTSFAFLLPYFVNGLGWAFMYHKSKNIWVVIIAHLANNLIGTIIFASSLGLI